MCANDRVTVFIVDGSTILQERLGALLVDLNGVEVIGHAQNAASAVSDFLSHRRHRGNRGWRQIRFKSETHESIDDMVVMNSGCV